MQFAQGFVLSEAQDALNLCMQLNGTGVSGVPVPDVTARWDLQYDCRVHDKAHQETRERSDGTRESIDGMGPFDNAWSGWKSRSDPDLHAVVIRGTVGDFFSMLDDAVNSSGILELA